MQTSSSDRTGDCQARLQQPGQVVVTGEDLTIDEVIAVARHAAPVSLSDSARARVNQARKVVDAVAESAEQVYGLNTELGPLFDMRVSPEEMGQFQFATIVGHAVSYGKQLRTSYVRAMMLVRVNGMARGGTGVRVEVLEAVIALLNEGVHPVVKAGGSVGQADLAEMSQIALVVVGLGEAEYRGEVMKGADALAAAGLAPLLLQPKEALGLISANGYSLGRGSLVLHDAIEMAETYNLAAALSLEAYGANLSILHPIAARMKPHPGHVAVAERLRSLLAGSYLWKKGSARKLQDSLSFRCIPQVHGVLWETCAALRKTLEIELNSGADNPIVSVEDGTLVSTGNFDVTNLAVAFDTLKVALIQVIRMSNERLHKHLWSSFSELPTGLARPDAPNSRLLPLSRTCSALTAEANTLASPVSLTYGSQLAEGMEDYASMAPGAVATTGRLIHIARQVAALELMISASAIDMRGKPQLGVGTDTAYEIVHAYPMLDANVWNSEIPRVVEAITSGHLNHWVEDALNGTPHTPNSGTADTIIEAAAPTAKPQTSIKGKRNSGGGK